jgi:tetratricopeptide (TPR) repeat protein
VKTITLLALLSSITAYAEDARVTGLLVEGDAQERKHQTRAALTIFRQAEQIEPGNIGVLLRIAKQYSDLVETTKPESIAKAMAEKSLEYGRRAIEIDPKSAKAHLTLAVCYGKLTDFVGNKTKVEYSRLIRDETVKSIALDPTDDFAWHVLGRWNHGVANVSGMLRAMARVVYGGLPPASNEEAVRCMKKACELAPQRIIHRSELARIYEGMKERELAMKEWQTVLTMQAVDSGDEGEKRVAREALGPAAVPTAKRAN